MGIVTPLKFVEVHFASRYHRRVNQLIGYGIIEVLAREWVELTPGFARGHVLAAGVATNYRRG